MRSVDTNIIIRFLTQDDQSQYKKAYTLFKKNDLFIPDTVILEAEWVLRFTYDFSADEICRAFTMLLGLPNVHTTNPVVVHQAIMWHEGGLDFSDALHLANSQHCADMLTFDKCFTKKSKGLSPCEVNLP